MEASVASAEREASVARTARAVKISRTPRTARAVRISRTSRASRRARTARAASAESEEMAAMAARAARGESIIIDIRQAHGSEPVRYLWGQIEVFKSEWKNKHGKLWTKPLPGKKRKKWVDVQTILSKLARFEIPAYLTFCRTNKLLTDPNYWQRKGGDPYEPKSPIPFVEGKQYFYLEMHGIHRQIDFDALPEYYRPRDRRIDKRPDTFYYRAPVGKNCTQHGPEYGYIPYDYAMSCFMSGVESRIKRTNDLLQLNGMTIMLRDYSDEECDISFLKRSATINGQFNSNGPKVKKAKPEMNCPASIEENPTPVDQGHLIGGTVKRKRRKRKTRKR